MMFEENVKVVKATPEQAEELAKALANMEPVVMKANVPDDEYYKGKIKRLERENQKLRNEIESMKIHIDCMDHLHSAIREGTENDRCKEEDYLKSIIAEKEERISKLEKALADAYIR